MKVKKNVILSLSIAAACALSALCGCVIQQAKSVVSIAKSDTVGNVDYYTITYSDGTTQGFTVTNGADGKDAEKLTAKEVWETYKEIYGDSDMSFAEFCEKYLSLDDDGTVNTDSISVVNSALLSCFMVYCPIISSSTYQATLAGGSGVIYKIDEESDYCYLLTNHHVVYDKYGLTHTDYQFDTDGDCISDYIYVYLYGSEGSPYLDSNGDVVGGDYGIKCEYVGGNATQDVAVLKAKYSDMTKINSQIKAVTVSTEYSVGEEVFAVGNFDGDGMSVTEGVINVDSEEVELDNGYTYRVLRTDADLEHGNSGGGLFNMNGEYIGMTNGGREDIITVNYALPAISVTNTADGILYYASIDSTLKTTKKFYLGVYVSEKNCSYYYDETTGKGYIKADITLAESTEKQVNPMEGKPAETIGLQAGDIITGIMINDTVYTLNRMYEMGDLFLTIREGDKIKIQLKRNDSDMLTDEYTVTADDLTAIK